MEDQIKVCLQVLPQQKKQVLLQNGLRKWNKMNKMFKITIICVYQESFSLSYRLDKVKEIIVTDAINLSKRLTTIATFLPSGAYFADIGSDHAYLPCYVCIHDKEARAIAGEVNEGPYNSACETVKAYELNNQIEVRLGDGLHVIDNEQIKQVVIAGMGGSLIRS